jgi:microcystin-dependent protein
MTASAPSPWAAPNYSSLTGSDAIALQQTFQSLSNYLEKINNSVTINASASVSPTGTVVAFAGSTAPSGWLLCDGGSTGVLRTTYSALFAVIGTTYGAGDGSTTFNVPDLRGRVAAGKDNMGGTVANRMTVGISGITGTGLGQVGGSESLHGHNHTQSAHNHSQTNHTHANTLSGTNMATDSHVHNTGSLVAAIGATNANTARIGYIAGGVSSGASTYSVLGTTVLTGQAFNHNTPVVGQTSGPTVTQNVSISNVGTTANLSDTTAVNVATGAGSSQNVQPTIILNYIIKA